MDGEWGLWSVHHDSSLALFPPLSHILTPLFGCSCCCSFLRLLNSVDTETLGPIASIGHRRSSSSLSQMPPLQSPPATKALPHKPNTYVLFYFFYLIALTPFLSWVLALFIIFAKTNRALHHLSETQPQLWCCCSSEGVNIIFLRLGGGRLQRTQGLFDPKWIIQNSAEVNKGKWEWKWELPKFELSLPTKTTRQLFPLCSGKPYGAFKPLKILQNFLSITLWDLQSKLIVDCTNYGT